MATEASPVVNPKGMTWAGWIVSGLVTLALTAGAVMKFVQNPDMAEQLGKLGLEMKLLPIIGTVELICILLYIIPWTAVLGAILLTGYLGGAVFTHVRVHDAFAPPLVIGVLVWVGLFLRDPRIRALIPFRR